MTDERSAFVIKGWGLIVILSSLSYTSFLLSPSSSLFRSGLWTAANILSYSNSTPWKCQIFTLVILKPRVKLERIGSLFSFNMVDEMSFMGQPKATKLLSYLTGFLVWPQFNNLVGLNSDLINLKEQCKSRAWGINKKCNQNWWRLLKLPKPNSWMKIANHY